VDQRNGFRDALKVHRPVEGRIPAAHQEDSLAFELPGIQDLEVEAALFVALFAVDAQLSCFKSPDAGCNDDCAGRIIAHGRFQHEVPAVAVLHPAQAGHHLSQVRRGTKL
jgi:hypothetical protein